MSKQSTDTTRGRGLLGRLLPRSESNARGASSTGTGTPPGRGNPDESNARGASQKRRPGRPSGNSSPYVISEHYRKTSLQVNTSQYDRVREMSTRTGIPIRDILARSLDESLFRYNQKGSPVAPRGRSKTVEEVLGPFRYPLDI